MAELEIGIFKSGRRAYGFDDIAIVPSRRTRDPEDVDISWQIDAYQFELPLLASAMDGVVSPATAIEIGRLGGLGVLNLEGLWTRYEDPSKLFDEIRELPTEKATARMQQMYSEPVQLDLVTQRIKEMKAAGITTAASVTPQKTTAFAPALLAAELDILGHPGCRVRRRAGRGCRALLQCGRSGGGDAGRLHLLDALGDQVGGTGSELHLLHPGGGPSQSGDSQILVEELARVLVERPQALEVEHAEPAEPTDLDGRGRASPRSPGRGQPGSSNW